MRYAIVGSASLSVSALRGLGQIVLQENFATGMILVSAALLCDWVDALCALLCTVVSTLAAIIGGGARRDVEGGLHGFNGALIGFALGGQLGHGVTLFLCATVAAAFVALLTSALGKMLASWERVLTAPFVMTTWILLSGMACFSGPDGTGGIAPAGARFGEASSDHLSDMVQGVLNGLSQIVLQRNAWMGLAVAAALAAASWSACAAALVGSVIGYVSAWALGGDPAAMRDGLYGYNSALTAIAASGLAPKAGLPSLATRLGMAIASTIVYALMTPALGRLGLPVLTSPFVVTAWLYLLARSTCRAQLRLGEVASRDRPVIIADDAGYAGDAGAREPVTEHV